MYVYTEFDLDPLDFIPSTFEIVDNVENANTIIEIVDRTKSRIKEINIEKKNKKYIQIDVNSPKGLLNKLINKKNISFTLYSAMNVFNLHFIKNISVDILYEGKIEFSEIQTNIKININSFHEIEFIIHRKPFCVWYKNYDKEYPNIKYNKSLPTPDILKINIAEINNSKSINISKMYKGDFYFYELLIEIN